MAFEISANFCENVHFFHYLLVKSTILRRLLQETLVGVRGRGVKNVSVQYCIYVSQRTLLVCAATRYADGYIDGYVITCAVCISEDFEILRDELRRVFSSTSDMP